MKLNYRRTILVGFAFFLICAFWQAYDAIIPMILTNKFGMSQALSGIIMAADNVLALVLLPLFGTLSDKCRSRAGRRTPFIVVGTLCAAVLLIALSFADNAQLKHISAVSEVDDPAGLQIIYEAEKDTELMTPGGIRKVTAAPFLREKTGETLETLGIAGETIRMPLGDCTPGDMLRGPVRNHRR
jgi:hypothetical protein